MNYIELAGRLSLQLEHTKLAKDAAEKVLEEIRMHLVCIGAPLNDNTLNFDGPQLEFLNKILNLVETPINEDE